MLFLSILFFAVTFFVGKTIIAGSDYEAGKIKYRIGVMGEEDEFIDMEPSPILLPEVLHFCSKDDCFQLMIANLLKGCKEEA